MPRLFVSSRSQPEQSHRQSSRARLPTDRALQAAALAADDAPIAMPSPSPPPVPSPPTVRAVPNATNDEGLPLVLVPPLPQSLTRLMDSHDLDNPYLVAAFNVLIENNNNPMRVPDILQAVMHRGWTQVLHRHKERPEQLFGNALRSHQRRREMMNRPSLVFMIDAGSCWKHHQLDLSAASGRKKGKIWCFSVDAGYSCPYGRLGLDLAYVIRAQEPGNLDAIKPSDDKHIREATDDTSEEPTRKKRKLATTKADPITLALLEAAVRGGVASVHSVASSLEPPPYIPAATIQPKPHEMPYGTRSTRATALLQRQPVLPLEIVPRSANINSHKRNRSTTPPEVNLDALTAMSPEPTTGEDSTTEVEVEIEDDPKSAEETSCEAEEVDNAEPDFSQLFTTPMTFSLSPPTPLMPSMDMPVVKADVTNESDDDEDDFHVTMNQFSAPTSSPVKIEIETDMSTAAPSPMEDFESSDGSSSIPRTPTPSVPGNRTDIASWSLHSALFELHSQDAPFHPVGLGYDIPNWDSEVMVAGLEDENQGWSRAGSPFTQFSDLTNRHEKSLSVADGLALTELSLESALEPIELDSIPFPAACLINSLSSNCSVASRSRRSSFSAPSRQGSIGDVTMLPSPIISGPIPMPVTEEPISATNSPRLSVSSLTSGQTPSHPLILYSPALMPTADPDRPFKGGLAHRYVVDMQAEEIEPEERLALETDVKAMEGLLNLADEPLPPSVINVVPPTPIRTAKRSRSPSNNF